jgi:DNA repair photolyase
MRRRILFTVEKNRVLVPVGEPCPFGCRYCYTRGGEVGLSRVSAQEILDRFQEFVEGNADSFGTIQFGYDGDPFARPERGITMLAELAKTGKHINFSTKALLRETEVQALKGIAEKIHRAGATLSALVSISCWDSAAVVEPHTPTPAERVLTIARLKEINIPVFISVRPILPHIADREYERMVDEALLVGCDGFILGPLYADEKKRFVRFIPAGILSEIPSKRGVVPWSAHAPTWTRYEDSARLARLQEMMEQKGGRVFLSSADAMALVREQGPVGVGLVPVF